MNKLAKKFLTIVSSRRFYKIVLIFFIFESAWIALTAAYPQAFDEQFHFGLIKLYSHHILPFLSKQPNGADQFGAVARDPSYLYHYVMSFPYRLIALITKSQAIQVIALRLIDIGLFTYGLTLFRKILARTKLSNGLAHMVILIFVLIPIVPQLAGQINYDDLLFPLVALVCLLCFKMIDEIRKMALSFKTTMEMLILATFASLVKYAFLPIFLAIICFFGFYLLRYYRHKITVIWKGLVANYKRQSLKMKLPLIALALIAGGMFAQRDLVNLVKYHEVAPDCSQVLTVNRCKAYSAWYADYTRHQSLVSQHVATSHNLIIYSFQWVYWMWYRLFFAVNGPASNFTNYPPLPLPSAVALIIGVLGIILVIKYRKELFKDNPYATLLMMASGFYIIALIVQGYSTYQFTAVLENMNGRYLLPVLLLAGAVFAKAFSLALKKTGHLKAILAGIVILLFFEGGGLLTYIARSNNTWYWQNSKAIKINNEAKKITSKLVVRGKDSYNTSIWFFN